MSCFLSVIIPVYNGEKYLKQTIMSVLNQPYKSIEIICVNDGSKDNSLEILNSIRNLEDRVKVISQNNQGVATARNNGIKHANGKYLAFLDQDDLWCTNVINEDLISEINNVYPDLISFGYYESNQNVTRLRIKNRENKFVTDAKNYAYENYRHHSSYFYKRDFILEKDIYVDEFRNEDERFRMQCIYLASTMLYIKKCLFIYRNNQYSVTHTNLSKECEVYVSCLSGYEYLMNKNKSLDINDYCRGFLVHTTLEFFKHSVFLLSKNDSFSYYLDKFNILYHLENIHLYGIDKKEWKLFFSNKEKFIFVNKFKKTIIKFLRYLIRNKYIYKIYEKKKYPIVYRGEF